MPSGSSDLASGFPGVLLGSLTSLMVYYARRMMFFALLLFVYTLLAPFYLLYPGI